MKKIKKILMGVTAIAMAFSMTAMTACVEGEGGGNQGGNQGGTEQGGNTPGGNTPGGTTPGGETPGGETPVTKTDAQKVMEAFGKQSFKAYGMEFGYDGSEHVVSYPCDAEGVMLAGATKEDDYSKHRFSVSQKMNFKNFEADMADYTYDTKTDKDGNPVQDEYNRKCYGYSFLRGGYEFEAFDETDPYGFEKPVTDFSKVTLRSYNVAMPEEVQALLALMPEDGVPAGMASPVSAVLNLADIYGAASFKDKKLTVNFNKVAYNLYNDVLKVIEDLDENTTVGDIIKATPVKNLIESLTYGIDTKEIYDQAVKMLQGAAPAAEDGADQGSMAEVILAALPQPTAGESVYAYLVRLLESKEVAELAFSMVAPGMPASAIAPIAQFKVSEIITMVMDIINSSRPDDVNPMAAAAAPAGTSMADIKKTIKDTVNSFVTATEDKVTITTPAQAKMDLSALELVFEVGDDYSVSSVLFSAEFAANSEHIGGSSSEPVKSEDEIKGSASGMIEFKKDEYTLTNINDNKVIETYYEYDKQKSYDSSLFDFERETEYRAYLQIEGGEAGVVVFTRNDANDEEKTVKTLTAADTLFTLEVDGVTFTYQLELDDGRIEADSEYDGWVRAEITLIDVSDEKNENISNIWKHCYLSLHKNEKTRVTTVAAMLARSK